MIDLTLDFLKLSNKQEKVKWPVVPRKGEQVYFNLRFYQVVEVIHNTDQRLIRVVIE